MIYGSKKLNFRRMTKDNPTTKQTPGRNKLILHPAKRTPEPHRARGRPKASGGAPLAACAQRTETTAKHSVGQNTRFTGRDKDAGDKFKKNPTMLNLRQDYQFELTIFFNK